MRHDLLLPMLILALWYSTTQNNKAWTMKVLTWTKAVVWKAVNSRKNPPPRRSTLIQFTFVIWKDSIVESPSSLPSTTWSFGSSGLPTVNDPLRTDESLSWTEDSCLKDWTTDASTSMFAARLVSTSLLIFVQAFPTPDLSRLSLQCLQHGVSQPS